MGLVLQYGLRKWSEALFIDDCDQVVKDYEAADRLYEKIEAELKGGGTE